MGYEEFISSLNEEQPPAGMTEPLKALWYDGRDDWESSHNVAQEIHDQKGSWIHAYLHRKEGDLFNARYWYSKAGKPEAKNTLEEEWELLVKAFL